ncbi:hypothetical protein [Desulfitobacterium chlororespirans]|uniref:MoeA N-terminal region (Domain I and II) n=1 Tax=Desulfitobacterium chlororespirans DSM 11544 TaxID=1121395 RepID=A0A1M7UH80_9FIRM|nr:hypothetical protein [Desulfitobacterium chlororespirans]SHN82362.1 MoeA N-terminal region (domain I and II) [Desulfitobacterium chlororespirans DSM 11544]
MSIENCAQPCRTCATRCHRQYGDYPTREEALELLFKEPSLELKTEYVALEEALGRITAEDVFSAFNVPNSDTATHDGFAIGIASASGKSNVLEKGEYIRLKFMDYAIKADDLKMIAPNFDGAKTFGLY